MAENSRRNGFDSVHLPVSNLTRVSFLAIGKKGKKFAESFQVLSQN
ncbi:hypothetical protein LEP1GSC171_2995 [Leptospira santarosai str. HAI1380]|nr:hypothetical protein LEP1GSC039_0371 [Leptospira santarosai str. 2000027870]EMP02034.1 hypothetical protein LEP1GSC171_2995 [Leptospira santarosai str. HAI1380]